MWNKINNFLSTVSKNNNKKLTLKRICIRRLNAQNYRYVRNEYSAWHKVNSYYRIASSNRSRNRCRTCRADTLPGKHFEIYTLIHERQWSVDLGVPRKMFSEISSKLNMHTFDLGRGGAKSNYHWFRCVEINIVYYLSICQCYV